MALVDAMHIGLELPGSRFQDAAGAGIARIIADNVSANLYKKGQIVTTGVCGAGRDWRLWYIWRSQR